MTELRKNVIDQIYQAVGSTYFGSDNYEVTFPDNGYPLAKIVFIARPSYVFSIHDDYNNEERVRTNESPGELKISDEYCELTIRVAIERIDKWARRIRQELSSTGVRKTEADDVFNQIDEYVKSLDAPDEGFAKTEIDQLQSQLSELQSKFEDLLEQSIITESELKNLKEQISGAEKDNFQQGNLVQNINA
jgi:chromosome condensin MukBEF ATPase and DNA-binding subunit MukB